MSNEQTTQSHYNSYSGLGHIGEFSKNTGWKAYLRKLKNYFDANDIVSANKKRAIFLNVIGDETVSTLCSLVSPLEPEDVPFDELLSKLTEHFEPVPNDSVECFKFYNRFQHEHESIADFAVALRALAATCNFSDLDKQLRVRLICGVRNESLQLRLLSEKNLTFQTALNIAKSFETAAKNLKDIRQAITPNTSVNKIRPAAVKPKSRTVTQVDTSFKYPPKKPCLRCGDMHHSNNCPFIHSECRYCKKIGHIAKVCLAKKRYTSMLKSSSYTHALSPSDPDSNSVSEADANTQPDESLTELNLFNSVSAFSSTQPFLINLDLNGVPCIFEVDSGASHTIMSMATFTQLWPKDPPIVTNSNISLRLWNNDHLQIVGQTSVQVQYKDNHPLELQLLLAHNGGRSLLGRDWFTPLGIQIGGIATAKQGKPDEIDWFQRFPTLVDGHTTAINCPPIHLELAIGTRPAFMRSRQIPMALRSKVEAALDDLIQQGTLAPTMYSTWATPIVPVQKANGSIRICMDYRVTVNPALKPNTYPLPTISDSLASLSGGQIFSHLDMSNAYMQLPLDEESSEILTINTHKGLFKVTRLPFGLSASPGIFQKFMDMLLADIPGVAIYLDDVVITGNDRVTHDHRLNQVLTRMAQAGLHLNRAKCQFNLSAIHFLGYLVTSNGIQPTTEKVEAIHNAPVPKNKTELQAFLGLINFYNAFLQNKATVAEPLHRLLNKGVNWKFGPRELEAFKKTKELIQTSDVLVHYDPSKELFLTCDASPVGVGAVLAHRDDLGRHRAIAFASRTLTPAERNYAQTDREGLAIIFGLQKFHHYIAGRHVIIQTDHKPLLGLLGPHKPVPQVISPRMLRWSLLMSAYSYDLKYVPGSKIKDADALSRLPLETEQLPFPDPVDVFMLESSDFPIAVKDIEVATKEDKTLSSILEKVRHGGSLDSRDPVVIPFVAKLNELSIQKNCLLWGSRVVIPQCLRKRVLQELHALHPGIVVMKAIARSYVWWPGIDRDIEHLVNTCVACQTSRHLPPKASPSRWEPPSDKWSRLHMDLLFVGRHVLLIVVDATTKWVEVERLQSSSTVNIVSALRRIFATHGLPETIVTDNASSLSSEEFSHFLAKNGIHHIRIPPYHPSSNGQAERYVQTVKDGLQRLTTGDLETQIRRFLYHHHSTPLAATNKSPAEMLFGRKMRTIMDQLHPEGSSEINTNQSSFNRNTRVFDIKDKVWMLNPLGPEKWLPAEITRRLGRVVYEVVTSSDVRRYPHIRHVDQLRRRI